MSTNETPRPDNPAFLTDVFEQNWESVRHVKNERIWFMNAYSLINAGILAVLQNTHASDLIRLVLLLFMTFFSVFGFLTSLRLKAELEECLEKIRSVAVVMNVSEFVALGHIEGKRWIYPRFRWLFPMFYAMTSAIFITLYRLITGHPMD